jgi:hypothetical protein
MTHCTVAVVAVAKQRCKALDRSRTGITIMSSNVFHEFQKNEVQYTYQTTEDGRRQRKWLGSGSYGTVYEGTFEDVTVAIKIIELTDPDHTAKEEAIKMFKEEADKQSRAVHPNIVAVRAAFVDKHSRPPKLMMIMERMEYSLHDVLYEGRGGPTTLQQRLEWMVQVSRPTARFHIL